MERTNDKKDAGKGTEKAAVKQIHQLSDHAKTVDKVGVEILEEK